MRERERENERENERERENEEKAFPGCALRSQASLHRDPAVTQVWHSSST